MLSYLRVSDFAIIEQIELHFHPGMTVLTGETGAGKSILIDAISLVLGDRASSEMIRFGKEKATIEALFLVKNDEIRRVLQKLGIFDYEEEVSIYREISSNNKNIIKINHKTVSLSDLKELSPLLADIHSQFDTQRLINPTTYLDLLDGFRPDLVHIALEQYLVALKEYKTQYQKYLSFVKRKDELTEKKEMYAYQLAEIEALHLVIDEETSIEEELSLLTNFDKIYSNLNEIKVLLDEKGLLDSIYDLLMHYEKLVHYAKEFGVGHELIQNFYYELKELEYGINDNIDHLNFDPFRLNQLQERSHELEKIQEKYQKTITELLEYRDFLQQSLDETENYDEYLKTTYNDLSKAFENVLKQGENLSQIRKQIAKKIESELQVVLKDLVLQNTKFEVMFSDTRPKDILDHTFFKETGFDEIDFYLSTNIGEPLKPLSKTASGGEMSRIMLAFKTIFIRSQNLSTIVFDEIDTGISGYVAKQIAKKIKEISKTCQVLSITHIPQVVSIGNHHLKVEKLETHNRTVAKAEYLTFEERVMEVAQMISGEKPTSSSINSAKELLLENQ